MHKQSTTTSALVNWPHNHCRARMENQWFEICKQFLTLTVARVRHCNGRVITGERKRRAVYVVEVSADHYTALGPAEAAWMA